MKEFNRHILLKGLSELPQHRAAPGLWERIEVLKLSVPKEALPVHQPYPATWEAVQAGIAGKARYRPGAVLLFSVIFLTILLGGVAWYSLYFNDQVSGPERSEMIPATVRHDKEQSGTEAQKTINAEKIPAAQYHAPAVQDVVPEEPVPIQSSRQGEKESISTALLPEENNAIKRYHPATLHPDGLSYPLIFSDFQKELSMREIQRQDPFYDCGFSRTLHSFSLSPGVEYQHMLNSNIPDGTENTYWYAFDLMMIYKINRFSIEAGVGIGSSKDKSRISYDYISNEIIHTYVYVDSIYYDPVTGTTQFFTTTVDVYDSIPHSAETNIDKKYTYLQIPLEIGYEFLKRKKYSLSLKAGANYFLETGYTETLPAIHHENSRITSMPANDCRRRKDFLRLSGGLEFRWGLNDHFSLTAEPGFHYYLNNIYDSENAGNSPVSAGLRLGLLYCF